MNLQDVTYETLLVYAINRIRKEYKTISAFARSMECKNIDFKNKHGKRLPDATIRQYLSYKDGLKRNRDIKFLIKLFKKLWNKTITYNKIIDIKVIIRADLY